MKTIKLCDIKCQRQSSQLNIRTTETKTQELLTVIFATHRVFPNARIYAKGRTAKRPVKIITNKEIIWTKNQSELFLKNPEKRAKKL